MPWPFDALLLLAAFQPIQAQEPAPSATSDPASPTPSEEQSIAHSTNIGGLMYTFDRAAWVSTDALLTKVPRDRLTGAGGYVVEPIANETLRVTYYRGDAAAARAFFHADIRDGKVVSDTLLPKPVALTPRQAALAAARTIATQTAKAKGYRPCTAATFNTVVLPSPDEGPITVYLLSAQEAFDSYPMGGHFRVIVGQDGTVMSARPYSKSCLTMKIPKRADGARPTALFVTHLLDPVPTEIHVFTSHSLRVPLFVGTGETRVWVVADGKIAAADLKP